MRLLMAPRAAASLCSTSAQWASSSSARRADSSCPMTFLVRETSSSFSRDICDIPFDYHRGVWYQGIGCARKQALARIRPMAHGGKPERKVERCYRPFIKKSLYPGHPPSIAVGCTKTAEEDRAW